MEGVAQRGGGVTISGNIQENPGCGPCTWIWGTDVGLDDPEGLLPSLGFGTLRPQHFKVLFGSEESRTESLETSSAQSPCWPGQSAVNKKHLKGTEKSGKSA